MTNDELIRNPTIENLTEFAVEKAARLVAKSEKIPIALYSIGDCMVNGLKFTGLPDAKTLEFFVLLGRHFCVAEAAKAIIAIKDLCVTDANEKPGQTLDITIEIKGLRVAYLYAIDRDQAGKPKLGKQLGTPVVTHLCQFDQLIPIVVPNELERVQACFELVEANFSATAMNPNPTAWKIYFN